MLTADLKIITANRSFYEMFHVTPEETEGRFVYSIGNHSWDIPALREVLEEIVPQNAHFNDFEVDLSSRLSVKNNASKCSANLPGG